MIDEKGKPEVFRLMGRRAWLAGHRSEATRLWGRGLAAARSLGMRPEVARLFHEVGFRLAETSKAPLEFEGRKPAEASSQTIRHSMACPFSCTSS